MYRIVKDGMLIGLTDKPNYIRKQDNGSYGLCPECDAQGIVFEGVVYHLLGRDGMADVDHVTLEEVDAGSLMRDNQANIAANTAAIDELLVAMLEV